MSFADNFRAWWKLFEDDVCARDMEFCDDFIQNYKT